MVGLSSQIAGLASLAVFLGTELKSVPALQTTWKHWKSLHPGILYVSAGNDPQPHSFELGERTQLKWEKDLSWADLAPGLQVEVKFVEGVREALEIKVLGGRGKRD